MANNLHISYGLKSPGQDCEKIIQKIQSLGNWAKIHQSYWYVNSSYTARQAADAIWGVMDANDSVYVVDSTNNQAAWQNIHNDVSTHVRDQWNK